MISKSSSPSKKIKKIYSRQQDIIKVPDFDKYGNIIRFTNYPLQDFLIKYHGTYKKNSKVPNLLHDFKIKVTEKDKNGNNVEKEYYWEEFKQKHKNWRLYSESKNSNMEGRGKFRYYVVEKYKKPEFLNEAQEEYLFQNKKRKQKDKEESKQRRKFSKEEKKFAKEINAREYEREKVLRALSKEERETENGASRKKKQSGKTGALKMVRSKERSPSKKRTREDDEKTIEEVARRKPRSRESPLYKKNKKAEGGRTKEEKRHRRAFSQWIKKQRLPHPPNEEKVYNDMKDGDFDELKKAIDEKFLEDIYKHWGHGDDVRAKIVKFMCEYRNAWNSRGRKKFC